MGPKQREQRRSVSLPASLRSDGPRSDVTIRNASARGLTIAVPGVPPPRGSYVDIRRGSMTLTGRVHWSENGCIGMRLQDRLDVAALVDAPRGGGRSAPVLTASMAVTDRGEGDRRWPVVLQYAAVATVPIGIAASSAWAIHDRLAAPFNALLSALG